MPRSPAFECSSQGMEPCSSQASTWGLTLVFYESLKAFAIGFALIGIERVFHCGFRLVLRRRVLISIGVSWSKEPNKTNVLSVFVAGLASVGMVIRDQVCRRSWTVRPHCHRRSFHGSTSDGFRPCAHLCPTAWRFPGCCGLSTKPQALPFRARSGRSRLRRGGRPAALLASEAAACGPR